MSSIYFSKRTITSATATTAAAGYPASNVALEDIRRPWRATGTGAEVMTINFSAAGAAAALLVQDVNFVSATVEKSVDGSVFTAAGTLTTVVDKLLGRRRGLIVINDATVKALRLNIGSGTPADGLSYWRIGATYPFALSSTLSRRPSPDMRVRAIYAQLRTDLPNRKAALASTGADMLHVSLPFRRLPENDALELVRRAREGVVGLDLAHADYPEILVPVRHQEDQIEESFPQYRISQFTAELREVV